MAQPTLLRSGLAGTCPRCGAKTLFAGLASFAPRCRACGLDFSAFNVGDGPAAFLTLIIGAVISILALILEFGFHPALWLHLVLWPLVTAAAVIFGLRLAKGVLLALEYRNAAREGRIAGPGEQ